MTSWRDSATSEAQEDLDGLVNAALPFAAQMLEQHGEFFPYGVALDASGEVRMIAGDPGHGERPPSADVLSTLVAGLRSQRDDLRAAALVSDVRLADSDAVRVELEHRDGHAIAAFLPYKQKRLRRGIEFGDLSADSGSPQVWSA
jgi:hypothetical protein